MLADIREGITYVTRHPTLRSAIALWTSFSIATAGLIPVIAYYVTIDRRLEPDALGFVISGYSVGSVAGALITSRLTRSQRSLGALMLGGQAAGGVLIGLLVLAPGLAGMILVSVIAGIASAIVMVSYITLRTAASPDAMLGRIGSTARTFSLGLQPIGMLVSGALLDAIGGAGTLLVVATFTVAVTTLFAFSGTLRSARPRALEKHAAPATGQPAQPTIG